MDGYSPTRNHREPQKIYQYFSKVKREKYQARTHPAKFSFQNDSEIRHRQINLRQFVATEPVI